MGTYCLASEQQAMQIENRIQLMQEGLKLSPDQVTDIRAILTNSNIKRQQEDKQYKEFKQDVMLSEKNSRADIDKQILAVQNR